MAAALPVDLRGRRIFLTGGTGFLGRSMLDAIAECVAVHPGETTVTVLSRDPAAFLASHPRYARLPWLRWRAGDVMHLDANVDAAPDGYTDVLHGAAHSHRAGDALAWIDQIYRGTRRALAFAVATGATRFLNVSSGAVYGPQPATLECLPESYTGAPSPALVTSAYGQAKRLAEQACTVVAASHAIEVVHARCFALVGEHVPLDGSFAIGNFLRDALHRDRIVVSGDGQDVRTYLDARNAAHWMLLLMRHGRAGDAYNVGSDEETTIGDLARRIARLVSPGKPVVVEGARSDAVRSRYVPDVSKAFALGASVSPALDGAIVRAAAALRGTAPRA